MKIRNKILLTLLTVLLFTGIVLTDRKSTRLNSSHA